MASKVLVPTAPFAKLQLKKSPPETTGSGFLINGADAVARVAHLEHSVRFLQEQHRQMLSGLHTEIEALRERNRDLQFQLIFNKESSSKPIVPAPEENVESPEEATLKRDVCRLEIEAAAARSEARAAEARALQLQRMLDAQNETIRALEERECSGCGRSRVESDAAEEDSVPRLEAESRAELRARLADAERLVRRLRADAERQRRECMKNSLHASLRATRLDSGNHFGFQTYYPPVQTVRTTDLFWRDPPTNDFNMASRGRATRRPLTLPELSGHQMHRPNVYPNNIRSRANLCDYHRRVTAATDAAAAEARNVADPPELHRLVCTNDLTQSPDLPIKDPIATYPELKVVVTKLIPKEKVTSTNAEATRARPRRHPRQLAPDHT